MVALYSPSRTPLRSGADRGIRCANIGWELVYGFAYPLSLVETLAAVPWTLTDLGIAHTLVRFGPREWQGLSLMEDHLPLIVTARSVSAFMMHWTFVKLCSTPGEAAF